MLEVLLCKIQLSLKTGWFWTKFSTKFFVQKLHADIYEYLVYSSQVQAEQKYVYNIKITQLN